MIPEENYGFIHGSLDISMLILYILKRLPYDVEPSVLFELCACDGGVGYFEYSDCLDSLVKNGNVSESENGYRITDTGRANAETVETSLPYSVRVKVNHLIEPVAEQLARKALVQTTTVDENGEIKVLLSLSDGVGTILDMNILCGSREQASAVMHNFQTDAEKYYQQILQMLEMSIE